jgi:glycosyltransferase involved in cell wall biosynthesis
MTDPLVTIAIPFYNNRNTIVEAVKSVFCQTYQNWELILLDDGSPDGTLELVKQIRDSRVRIETDGENRGLIYRLNQVPLLAQGDYLARMDADDLMDPLRISKQMAYMKAHPATDLVDTGTYSISEKGEPVGIRGTDEINYSPVAVLKKAMLLHASILGKKEWFLNNKYDKNYERAEDYELWCRTFQHSKFGRVCEPLYIVREGKVNLANYRKSLRTVRKIFRVYGPEIVSKTELQKEILKNHLKVLVYDIFGALNKQDFLSSKRNHPLRHDEKEKVERLMTEIRQTVVPGWE